MNFSFEMIANPMRSIFILHIFSGLVALIIFLVPLLSKKGGSLHVKAGWIYVCAMVTIGLTSFIITPWRVFFDPERTMMSISFSAFLFYIGFFTLCCLWYGLTTLKFKSRLEPGRLIRQIGPPFFLIFLGIATQLLGFFQSSPLLMAFPILGHVTAKSQLDYWLKPTTSKMHWWYAHMNGMFTACIATVTAFLVTALPRIWQSDISNSPVLWIAPGIIMGTILNRWVARSKIKFEKLSKV